MAIHGKQLKDASIDLTKLEGIAAAPTAGQLLVAASNGSMQALSVGGDLTASVSGGTLDLSIGLGTIQLSMIDAAAIVSEAEGIGSNDNDTTIPTSAAVKDYVDTEAAAQDLDFSADSGTGAVLLDSQALEFTGGTGIDTSASGKTVTLAIDSTVATLTGSQTLTNKTLTSAVLNTGVSGTAIKDEDDMASDSATHLATQQSIKKYVDDSVASAGGGTMSKFTISDGSNTQDIEQADTLTFAGTTNEVDVAVSATDTLTIGLPANVTVSNDLDVSNDLTVAKNLVVGQNLTVNGTTTTVNSTTVTVDDPIFTLGGDSAPSSDDNKDRGIEFRWHNGTAAKTGFFGFDDSTGRLAFIPDATNTNEVFSGTLGAIEGSELYISGTSAVTSSGAAKVQSAVAGQGLAHASGVLSLDLNQLDEKGIDVATDSVVFIDSDDSNISKKETVADLVTGVAGDGLAAASGVLSLSLNELTAAAVNVAGDSIAIIDASDSNNSRKESIADLATAMAGTSASTGVKATNGVFEVTLTSFMQSGSIASNQTDGSTVDVVTLTHTPVAAIDLRINGIAYPQGTSTAGYWYNDNGTIKWNDDGLHEAGLLLDTNDKYQVIYDYFAS